MFDIVIFMVYDIDCVFTSTLKFNFGVHLQLLNFPRMLISEAFSIILV